MEHWWNDDRENWSMWIKHVSVPLCPPQVPCVMAWDWTWPTWWQAVNYLCHGTAVKILITVWVCPVVITCHLLHCSCVWLCHSTNVNPWTDSVHTLYCIIRVKCPSSHIVVTSWHLTSIHKQLYRHWINCRHHYGHRTWKHKQFHYK
jgi:hypothetical protein